MTTLRTVAVLVQARVNVDRVRCPICGSEAQAFDRPELGKPWHVCCASGHEYYVDIIAEDLS